MKALILHLYPRGDDRNEVLHIEFRPQGPITVSRSAELVLRVLAKMEAQLGQKSRD
jgi:hypothetical protein